MLIFYFLFFSNLFFEIFQAPKHVTVKAREICVRTFYIENLILHIFYFNNFFLKIDIYKDIIKKLNFEVYQPL